MTAVLAAGACAAAALLILGPRRRRRSLPVPPRIAGLAALATVALVDGRIPPALVVVGCGGGVAVLRELRRRRAGLVEGRRREAVLAFCEALAADLESGAAPVAALTSAVEEWPEFWSLADAAQLGADVPGAMRTASELPGAGELRLVAAAWVVAHRSGAGLASAVGLAARTIREDRAAAQVVATELASANATARLLAALPVGVLLIGRGAGGDPVGFLLGTTPGLVCLTLGLGLSWAGLLWLQRIADGIRRA